LRNGEKGTDFKSHVYDRREKKEKKVIKKGEGS